MMLWKCWQVSWHSVCQETWKTQQWPQDWKGSVFIPIPKKGNAKKCSNYHIIALISHASQRRQWQPTPVFLPGKIPWTEKHGRLQSMGSQRVRHDWATSLGHCWVFQICWHMECSTFIASSFRIWNSLTGIPSPPLAFFVVMLSKDHLTSHSRMSGSMWMITPL